MMKNLKRDDRGIASRMNYVNREETMKVIESYLARLQKHNVYTSMSTHYCATTT